MYTLSIQFPLFQVTGVVTFLRGYQGWFLEPGIWFKDIIEIEFMLFK